MKNNFNGSGVIKRIISGVLIFAVLFSQTACGRSSEQPAFELGQQTINEVIIPEEMISEGVFTEFITSEIYLKEIITAETKITELLLEEETIEEVICCRTIYVCQDNLDEFATNSQTIRLFGDNIDISSLLKKISVGTGVIVTVVVLKIAGLPEPVASVVTAAADASLKFAGSGAAIGSLFGGLTGTADEIDETGRMSAIIGFATATAGLIMAIVSLATEIPSAGSTTITAAAGVNLVIAGISVIAATAGTAYSGYQAIKTFTSTDSVNIDWKNINWKKVGASAAQKAINNGADGYMWGAITGFVYGGAEGGVDYYQKYNTPYTKKEIRLKNTPKDGNGGRWKGARGESDFILDDPIVLSDGTKIDRVTYKNAVPDFSKYQKAQVKISKMTNDRYSNFEQADTVLAEYWSRIKYNGSSWTAREVSIYRNNNNLTWHEMSNMETMQLVPREVNQRFSHSGGVAEYNAMIGQEGGMEFD